MQQQSAVHSDRRWGVRVVVAGGVLSAVALVFWLRGSMPQPIVEKSPAEYRAILESGAPSQARADAADALGRLRHEGSVDLLFAAMDDPDPWVRGRAGAAIRKILGYDCHFRTNDPPDVRRKAIEALKADWVAYQDFQRTGARPPTPEQTERIHDLVESLRSGSTP